MLLCLLMMGAGYPIQSWTGGLPYPVLDRAIPLPLPGPGKGVPPPPPAWTWQRVPPLPPTWTWEGANPCPPAWTRQEGTPHLPPGPGKGVLPPPPRRCEQTDTSENSTFPRTTYAGGNNGIVHFGLYQSLHLT